MSSTPPVTFAGSFDVVGRRIDPEETTVEIGGTDWGGWTSVRITRRADACPNDFEVGITTLYPGKGEIPAALDARPGNDVIVWCGRDKVITGYLDRRVGSMNATGRQFGISGRGKCQDLVDCAAVWPGQTIKNADVLGVANKLAEPYGIEVRGVTGPTIGTPTSIIPAIGVPHGTRAFEIIEELCRLSGLLAYEDADGALVLTEGTQAWPTTAAGAELAGPPAGATVAASGLVEGINVEAASASFTIDGRFSEYRGYRYGFDKLRDVKLPNLIATAEDKGVTRPRFLDILVEPHPQLGYQFAVQRANFERSVRWGRSAVVRITTDSWRDSAGKLYAPFTLISLQLPSLGITEAVLWMISEVTYRRDESGTHCDLTVLHPLAFTRLPALPAYPLPRDVMSLANQFQKGP